MTISYILKIKQNKMPAANKVLIANFSGNSNNAMTIYLTKKPRKARTANFSYPATARILSRGAVTVEKY